MSSTSSQKEHLKAACSDLERIRRLKKEAEFLEVSFRTKAAFLQQVSFAVHFKKKKVLSSFCHLRFVLLSPDILIKLHQFS